MKKANKIQKFFFYSWLIFLLVTLITFVYVIFVRRQLLNEAPTSLGLIFLGAFGLGIVSFILGVFTYALRKTSKDKVTFLSLIKSVGVVLVFPVYFIVDTLKSLFSVKPKGFDRRYVFVAGAFFVVLPFWMLGYLLFYMGSTRILGLRYSVYPMLPSESMVPSFPGGSVHKAYTYKNVIYTLNPVWAYQFKHGDVVVFSNETTLKMEMDAGVQPYAFLKRVIGLPGDYIQLADGVVFRNGQPLEEPYTPEPNSTYAGSGGELNGHIWMPFMKECETITVPGGKLFVLGDNRKHSDDSRVVGFIDMRDVLSYLPYTEQTVPYYEGVTRILHSEKWRDTSMDITVEVIKKAQTECQGR